MAKSDSFFVRASTSFNGTTYVQSSIDLGAYVDALGKSVLRVHNVSVMYGDSGVDTIVIPAGQHRAGFQITTQSQTAMIGATDKSLVSAGSLYATDDAQGNAFLSQSLDVAPQHFSNGYLIGVEQIYLGIDQTVDLGLTEVGIVLECTVETLSQSAAMALALSQQ